MRAAAGSPTWTRRDGGHDALAGRRRRGHGGRRGRRGGRRGGLAGRRRRRRARYVEREGEPAVDRVAVRAHDPVGDGVLAGHGQRVDGLEHGGAVDGRLAVGHRRARRVLDQHGQTDLLDLVGEGELHALGGGGHGGAGGRVRPGQAVVGGCGRGEGDAAATTTRPATPSASSRWRRGREDDVLRRTRRRDGRDMGHLGAGRDGGTRCAPADRCGSGGRSDRRRSASPDGAQLQDPGRDRATQVDGPQRAAPGGDARRPCAGSAGQEPAGATRPPRRSPRGARPRRRPRPRAPRPSAPRTTPCPPRARAWCPMAARAASRRSTSRAPVSNQSARVHGDLHAEQRQDEPRGGPAGARGEHRTRRSRAEPRGRRAASAPRRRRRTRARPVATPSPTTATSGTTQGAGRGGGRSTRPW